jgi:hypothetical protein
VTPVRKIGIAAAYLVLCVALAVAVAGFPALGRQSLTTRSAAFVPLTTTTTVSSADPATATTTSTTVAAELRPPKDVKVRLYNGSRTGGAAVTVGKRVEALGYDVLDPGVSPADPYATTAVWFAPGWSTEATKLAQHLGVDSGAVSPLPDDPPVGGIGDAVVVVVVADDVVAAG